MRELITTWAVVACYGAHLRHVAAGIAFDLYGQEAFGWAGGAVELQRFDCVIAHGLCLLNGIDGQDDFISAKVECSLNDFCRHWEALHDARLKWTDFAG